MAGLQRLPNGLKGSYQQIVKDNEQKDLSLDLLNIVPLKTLSTPLTQQQQFPEWIISNLLIHFLKLATEKDC